MNGNDVLHSLGEIDEALVADAAELPNRKPAVWKRYGALAACLVLLLGAAFASGLFRSGKSVPAEPTPDGTLPETDAYAGLPLLDISMEWGGMGFEGIMELDPAELENGNPWREDMALTTLPVYRNLAYDETHAGEPRGLDVPEMTRRLYAAAEKLGFTVTETEELESLNEAGNSVYGVRALTTDGTAVEIDADGLLTVDFEVWRSGKQISGGLELPERYHFAGYCMTEEEAESVTAYLAERFSALLGMEKPQIALFHDYTFSAERTFDCTVYDDAGDDVQRILNYAFSRAWFAPNDEEKLMLLRMKNELDLAEKLGDYPILTLAEATEKLARGEYLTSVPCDCPGVEKIARAELVYRGGALAETLLPFYRFYVELPDDMTPEDSRALGIKTYGAYYVPAVQGRFIATISFNGTVIGG